MTKGSDLINVKNRVPDKIPPYFEAITFYGVRISRKTRTSVFISSHTKFSDSRHSFNENTSGKGPTAGAPCRAGNRDGLIDHLCDV